MKKSLLALAVLGAFAGAASAQSSVTLYGRVDMGVGKEIGSANKFISQGSGSRLGLRGSEDLGGGLSAIFNIEHRFEADTGVSGSGVGAASSYSTPTLNGITGDVKSAGAPYGTSRFWSARSLVGLKGGFGQITLGREYTTAFLGSQLLNDPWGWDTQASKLTAGLTGGGVAAVRNDSAITYNFAASGFAFGIQTAESADTINRLNKRPLNFSLGYAAGPVAVNFGYEKTGAVAAAAAKVTSLGGSYDLGAVKLGASMTRGNTAANVKVKSYLLTATAPVGQGEFRAAVGQHKTAGATDVSALILGYHYSLSKRTTLYTDFARNSKLASDKIGYDFGIKHNF